MTAYCPRCNGIREVEGFTPLTPPFAEGLAPSAEGAVVLARFSCSTPTTEHKTYLVIGKDWNNGREYRHPRTRRRASRSERGDGYDRTGRDDGRGTIPRGRLAEGIRIA